MPYIGPTHARYAKKELRSPDFTLPPLRAAPSIIKSGLFTWDLEPYNENEERIIRLTCSKCHKYFLSYWPIRSSNYVAHYKKCSPSSLSPQQKNYSTNEAPSRGITPSTSGSNSSSIMTPYATNSSSCGMEADCTGVGKKRPNSDLFDAYEFRKRLIDFFLSSSEASFQLLKCPFFLDLLRYFDGSVPSSISLSDVRLQLQDMYAIENSKFKQRLAENESRYAIIINEWTTSNQCTIAMANLQFYNADFALERYTIGLEVFQVKKISYAGGILCKRLLDILDQLEIKDRIISITRDDIDPLNITTENSTDRLCADLGGLALQKNERTVSYHLQLATRAFLDYTFFTENTSESFKDSLEKLALEQPSFNAFSERVKALPREIRSIIEGIEQNDYLNSTFQAIVNSRKTEKPIERDPLTPLHHQMFPCLSVHGMVERFIHYRGEITELLKHAKSLPKYQRHKLGILTFDITDDEWDHLVCVRDILAIFIKPIIHLQGHAVTITNTLPYVHEILESIYESKVWAPEHGNHYVALGVQEAYEQLSEHYYVYDDQERAMKHLYIATVLDPRYKLGLFKDLNFTSTAIEGIKDQFYKVYEFYKSDYRRKSIILPRRISGANRGDRLSNFCVDNAEVEKYFSEQREQPNTDVLDFYRSHKSSFPVLYRMAKDFLATPAIAVPTEPSFARSDIPTEGRNSAQPTEIEMKVIMRSRGFIARKVNQFKRQTPD